MRDAIHIMGLALLFVFLAVQYPLADAVDCAGAADTAAFASFITLSPAAHAAYIDATRTSWQVSNEARGMPSIGRLDSDVPMLSNTLPPIPDPNPDTSAPEGPQLPSPDPDVYSLIPPTMGGDVSAFAVRSLPGETDRRPGDRAEKAAFGRDEMLSVDNYRSLKEIMQ